MKKCNKCGEIKEFSEFSTDRSKKCLYVSPCKACKGKTAKLRVRKRRPPSLKKARHKLTLLQRFEPKYKVAESGCWEWQAFIGENGYGMFRIGHRMVPAQRASYIIFNGDIPNRYILVCHHCDNPKCVNPNHLFLGTHQDNMDDMIKKGRNVKREKTKNGGSIRWLNHIKITPEQIRQQHNAHNRAYRLRKKLAEQSIQNIAPLLT